MNFPEGILGLVKIPQVMFFPHKYVDSVTLPEPLRDVGYCSYLSYLLGRNCLSLL